MGWHGTEYTTDNIVYCIFNNLRIIAFDEVERKPNFVA